ncbi:uncharacterized protein GIQ15_01316 [Arthroderma uncinatum]|uniref:uncharacterized protein n=1 Tax=Arthroderma uncinatum TaxID=74035 RepID=UPI00144A5CC6|nr:uncharacterized protein GIQ15_01316 [Arthroderma uncinatum]KAF3491799.1 hypothetical protein GIQ15_01316 [Arthroderma uncinatum]
MPGFETTAAAISVAEVTIKVLTVGYSFVSDVRHYGVEAATLGLKFQQLSHSYDSLQKVLFESGKFPFLHGEKLFDVLPEYSQKLVVQLLRELLRLLYAHFVLEQKYAASSQTSGSNPEFVNHFGLTVDEERILLQSTSIAPGNEPEGQKTLRLAYFVPLVWAIQGKRKAARLNKEFEDWLMRTRAVLEDTWWPLPAFNVLSNLDAVQSDPDTRAAGLATSTALRKLLIDQAKLPEDLKTSWDSVKNVKILPSGKMIGVFSNSFILVETLTFSLDIDGNLPDILDERFSKIVRLLNSQSDPDFRVLRCLKYCNQISASSGQLRLISYISDSDTTPTIRTLADLYRSIRPDKRPSLGLRFSMCHQLAESLFLLHSVNWVHRALRSENVLFVFPDENLDRAALQGAKIRICGFEASRPSTDSSLGPYDNQLKWNVYRHPKRWGTPRETFTRIHDIYSVGVMMLEIGLWESAEEMISGLRPHGRIPENVTQFLLRHTNERLIHRCGDVFAGAVRKCLTLNFEDGDWMEQKVTPQESDSQQEVHGAFLEHVVEPLKLLKEVV